MVRPLAVYALAALLSTTVAAAGDPQTKPKPAAPRKAAPKPAPAAPAQEPAKKVEPPPAPATDVRMKTAFTQGPQVSQNTTYLQGARQRVEFPGVVTLDQCDLKRSVMLNVPEKRYMVQPYAVPTAAGAPAATDAPVVQASGIPAAPRGGVVTFTTTLTDTLERQTMLGLEARRIKSVVIKQFSKTACDKSPLKVEVDAWYVDLPAQSACARAAAATPPPSSDPNACTDRVETSVSGDAKLGFPVKTVTVTTTGEGEKVDVSASLQEVTELEITRLDRALFDVPADFVEAKSSAEIVPAFAKGGSLTDVLFGSTADGTSTAATKKAGVIRIGILEPINKTDRDLPASGLRRDLAAKFNKAPYEAIPVAGSSPSAIAQEAARLECDYLMLAEIVEAKTSKPGKMGKLTSMTGGGPPKDAQDVKLEYKLYAVGATQAPKASGSAKASSGGFGVGSALRIAAFAGQMYMGVMMGGMGMGMGMNGMGGSLGAMGGGFFDPRATAMNSMVSGFGGMASGMGGMPGMGDPSDSALRETVSEALGNSAKATMEQLGKKK